MSTTETPVTALSWEADWVQRNAHRRITPDQARCIDALSALQRPYNWPLIGDGWHGAVAWPHPEPDWEEDRPPLLPPVVFGEKYVVVRLEHATLATFDMDELTRLVLAAHQRAVRIEIAAEVYRWIDTESYLSEYVDGEWVETNEHPSGPGSCLRIAAHARESAGRGWERHPSLLDLISAGAALTQPAVHVANATDQPRPLRPETT